MRLRKMAQKRHLESWSGATIPCWNPGDVFFLPPGVDVPDEGFGSASSVAWRGSEWSEPDDPGCLDFDTESAEC